MGPGEGCFTKVSRALQNVLLKFVYSRNHTSYGNFKLKFCMCAHSHAMGTHTRFQLDNLTINVISAIVYFCKIILESSWNISKQPPGLPALEGKQPSSGILGHIYRDDLFIIIS